MRFFVIVVIMFFMVGCATRPLSITEVNRVPESRVLDSRYSLKSENTAVINIKRDAGIFGSACSSRVYVNSLPIADLRQSEMIALHLPPSDYIFSVWPQGVCGGGLSEIQATATLDSPTNLRIGYGSNGDFYINHTAF